MAFDLSSIQRGGHLKPPIAMIYGVAGISKTTLAAGAPDVVFLPVEDGIGSNDVAAFPKVGHLDNVFSAIETLGRGGHNYQWLAIDSATALEKFIYAAVCEDHNVSGIEDLGYGKGYQYALEKWLDILSWLVALRDHTGMGVLLIGHADVVTFKNPEGDDYDRYQISLDKRAFKLIVETCDLVAFMNYKVVINKETAKATKGKAVNRKQRAMFFNQKPAYIAKNRYALPDVMDIPDLTGLPQPEIARRSWATFGQMLNDAIANNGRGGAEPVAEAPQTAAAD